MCVIFRDFFGVLSSSSPLLASETRRFEAVWLDSAQVEDRESEQCFGDRGAESARLALMASSTSLFSFSFISFCADTMASMGINNRPKSDSIVHSRRVC